MSLETNLVSHYVLDSDLTDGVGSNDLSLDGAGGSYVAAKLGNGFDGENTADLEDSSFSGFETDPTLLELTFDMWINLQTSKSSAQYLGEFLPLGLTGGTLRLLWHGVNLQFGVTFRDKNGTYTTLYSSVYDPAPVGEWHHVLGWYDQSEFGLVIDNSDETSNPHGGMPTSGSYVSGDFHILNYSPLGSSNRTDGIVDNVGVWDRALTAAERDTRYNAGTGLAYPFPTPGKPNILIW